MRTKNGKRIGPVPIALVAVFALAAFISAGLLIAVSVGQTAEAQSSSCTVDSLGMSANSVDVVPNEACDVAGESATIKIEGTQPTNDGDPWTSTDCVGVCGEWHHRGWPVSDGLRS